MPKVIKKFNILSVLKTFSKKEIEEFRLFLSSPFHNSHKKTIRLYEIIIEKYLHLDYLHFNPVEIYKVLFKSEFKKMGYSDSTMRNELFLLLVSAERFLTIKNFLKYPLAGNEYLRNELLARELSVIYKRNLIKSREILEEDHEVGPLKFLPGYNLEQENINNSGYQSGPVIRKNEKMPDIKPAAKNLVFYFVTELMSLTDNFIKMCKKNNYTIPENNFLAKVNEKIDMKKFLRFLKSEAETPAEKIIIDLYINLIRTFQYVSKESYYFKFRDLLFKNVSYLGIDLRQYFFSRLADYCILKRSSGSKTNFSKELFFIYTEMVENKYYMHTSSSYLPADLFRNILITALREKQYGWLKAFTEISLEVLRENVRYDLYNYAKARLAFELSNFDDCLKYLNNIGKDYHQYSLDVKSLFLKTFYETSAEDRGAYFIDSFRHHISTGSKIPAEIKSSFKKFIRFTERLFKEKNSFSSKALLSLKFDIESEQNLVNKKWLYEKVLEIEKAREHSCIIKDRKTKTYAIVDLKSEN